MNTNRTTRFAGLMLAVLMTLSINSLLLVKFDSVAHEGYVSNGQRPSVVTLNTVKVVAHRS
jgi:hypothetical protein